MNSRFDIVWTNQFQKDGRPAMKRHQGVNVQRFPPSITEGGFSRAVFDKARLAQENLRWKWIAAAV